ncbi:MAG: pilin [Patescibacteria group bacterium]
MNKKILFITIVCLITLFGFWQIARAIDLLLDYPEIGGIKPGETIELPEIIKYFYLFALGIVGVIALLSMLIGAIKYIFSAGNPSKAGEAKDQIFSAILGIIILLASVLILRTINPDLVSIGFKLPEIKGGGGGASAYPYVQCYISRLNLCSAGQSLYRECVQSFTTNIEEARKACVNDCRSQTTQLGGVPYCNVYSNRSQCQPTGCH